MVKWPPYLRDGRFLSFATATQFIGGIVRTILTLFLAGYCYQYLSKNPSSKQHWETRQHHRLAHDYFRCLAGTCGGTLENQFILMSLTRHPSTGCRSMGRRYFPSGQSLVFTSQNNRFRLNYGLYCLSVSLLRIASVAMILISGLPIALQYIDTWNGLSRHWLRQFINGKSYFTGYRFWVLPG